MRAEVRKDKIVLVPESSEEFIFFEVEHDTLKARSKAFEGEAVCAQMLIDIEQVVGGLFIPWCEHNRPDLFLSAEFSSRKLKRIRDSLAKLKGNLPFGARDSKWVWELRQRIKERWSVRSNI